MKDDPKNTQSPGDDSFDVGFEDDLDIDVDAVDEFPAEDWDEGFEESTEAAPAPIKKRKLLSGKSLLVILGVFVLAAGWMLLGGNKTAKLPEGSEMPPADETPLQAGETAGNNGDMPPMPAPINAGGEETAATEAAPDEDATQDSLLNVPKVPAVPADRRLSEVDVNAPPASTQPVPVQDSAPAAADNSAGLLAEKEKEMADKLTALEKSWQERFAAMETDLKQKAQAAEDQLAQAENKSGGTDTAMKNLQEENAALKTQIETLKAEQQTADAAMKAVQADAQKAREEASATQPATAPAQKAEDLWILRSAQPGKALISQKGSDVMQSIKTGDAVPGLGTVLSIKFDKGRWIVTGTEGTLSS